MNKRILLSITALVIGVVSIFGGTPFVGTSLDDADSQNPIKLFESGQWVRYENKKSVSVQVIQALTEGFALAVEGEKSTYSDKVYYLGKTILIYYPEHYFYDKEIINITDPLMVGLYTYTNIAGRECTIPMVMVSPYNTYIINK